MKNQEKEIYKQKGIKLLSMIRKAGYEGYFVGGCVRDMVMGREYTDIDIAVSCAPSVTLEIFRKEGYTVLETGIKHGTVMVICDGEPFEITTYRIDGEYVDCRHPEKVEFTNDITLDLSRRDFTVNAMAMDEKGNIIDPFGGMEDIRRGIIRAVGLGEKRFSEDALRIIRGCRFAATLGFKIEEGTFQAMTKLGQLMKNVAGERIYTEFRKLMMGDSFATVLYDCRDIIDKVLYPMPFTQKLSLYPKYLTLCAYGDIANRFCLKTAALICLCGVDREGSELILNSFIKRMKCDRKTANDLQYIISEIYSPLKSTPAQINREIAKWGGEIVTGSLYLRSNLATFDILPLDERVFLAIEIAERISKNGALTIKDLAINGNDLIDLGINKGRELGEKLDALLDKVVNREVENTRECLLNEAVRNG